MGIDDIKKLSKFRFEKAYSNMAIAKSLYESGEYVVALNRTYYALFDAIRAINALDGFDSSKHSGVIAYFNHKFVKSKVFSTSTSDVIKKAAALRESSDYEDFYKADKNETLDIINKVENFLNEVKIYLQRKSIIK